MQEQNKVTGGSGSSTGGGGRGKALRTFTFSLTMPKLVFCAVMATLLLSWSFIFGIIMGRGMSPEDSIPHLAGVMPSPLAPPEDDRQGYLKPEDLAYHANLKGNASPARPVTQNPANQQPPQSPLPPQTRGTPPAQEPQRAQSNAPERQTPPSVPPAIASASKNEEAQFDYLYQVAAFKDSESAERLLVRLKQQGLQAEVRTQQQSDATWYRMFVLFRGTPEDTRTLRDALAPLGINQILLRSKTPVQR